MARAGGGACPPGAAVAPAAAGVYITGRPPVGPHVGAVACVLGVLLAASDCNRRCVQHGHLQYVGVAAVAGRLAATCIRPLPASCHATLSSLAKYMTLT